MQNIMVWPLIHSRNGKVSNSEKNGKHNISTEKYGFLNIGHWFTVCLWNRDNGVVCNHCNSNSSKRLWVMYHCIRVH